jgi:putative transposase
MQRKHNFAFGEFYHVYNRGNNKQAIFLDDYDRERFLKILYIYNTTKNVNFRDDIVERKIDAWDFDRGDKIVSIGAWVLMPNHFHLYITPKFNLGVNTEPGELLSKFMQKVLTSYSKYFNKKYSRTGGLFEGTFGSVHVETDEQAKYLFSYIHLNPIKLIDKSWKENGIKDKEYSLDFLSKYKWSSYIDYKGVNRSESKIISIKNFPEYFSNISDFDQEIIDWLEFNESLVINPV